MHVCMNARVDLLTELCLVYEYLCFLKKVVAGIGNGVLRFVSILYWLLGHRSQNQYHLPSIVPSCIDSSSIYHSASAFIFTSQLIGKISHSQITLSSLQEVQAGLKVMM